MGEHCSATERRADDATRDASDTLKCEFMLDKVGESFEGVISGVNSFGVFVELDGVYVSGLVHITALDYDYFHFDPVGHRLTGERTGRVYRLGDTLKVKVAAVNIDDRKIDFVLAEKVEGPGKGQGRPKRDGGSRRPGRSSRKAGAGEAKPRTKATGNEERAGTVVPKETPPGGGGRRRRRRKN
jgi:ribonuclease R